MNVKQLRNKTGLSQQDLSDETGIPKGRIAQWEVDKAKPKMEDYNILVKFFTEKGVWEGDESTGNGMNESGLLYKHAYEGALDEIDKIKSDNNDFVKWRAETMATVLQNKADLKVVLEALAEVLAHLKDKDEEVILADLRNRSAEVREHLAEGLTQRTVRKIDRRHT